MRIVFPIAPSPKEKRSAPARQSATLSGVELRGVISDTVIKRSIPPPSEPQIASQVFCFAAMLMRVNIETKTGIRNIFARMHIRRFRVLSP